MRPVRTLTSGRWPSQINMRARVMCAAAGGILLRSEYVSACERMCARANDGVSRVNLVCFFIGLFSLQQLCDTRYFYFPLDFPTYTGKRSE